VSAWSPRQWLRAAFDAAGYEVRRKTGTPSAVARVLRDREVDVVFDVGANTGQFAQRLRAAGYLGQIVSFEPLPDAHEVLTRASHADRRWAVAPRTAIGASAGSVEIHVAGNSYSSSILPMEAAHVSAAPESRYVGAVTVSLQRLDDAGAAWLGQARRPFVKIDTQGYESAVLDGAPQTLAACLGVQLEMSLVPLYRGEVLYRQLIDRLDGLGFDLWSLEPGFADPATGRLLQVDGVFIRR
jgi:FkbM family methyltransferase